MRIDETIGHRIACRRSERGLSQRQLAEQLCAVARRATVTRTEVARWERGDRLPGPYWRRWLAHVLEVPPAALRSGRPSCGVTQGRGAPLEGVSGATAATDLQCGQPAPVAAGLWGDPARAAAYQWLTATGAGPSGPRPMGDPALHRWARLAILASHRVGGLDLVPEFDRLWAAALSDRSASGRLLLAVAQARVRVLADADELPSALTAGIAALAATGAKGPHDRAAGAALLGESSEVALLLGEPGLARELAKVALLGLPVGRSLRPATGGDAALEADFGRIVTGLLAQSDVRYAAFDGAATDHLAADHLAANHLATDKGDGGLAGAPLMTSDGQAIRARLSFQLAYAAAITGDRPAATESLRQAANLSAARLSTPERVGLPGWLAAGLAARCQAAMGRPAVAVRLFEEAIRAVPPADRAHSLLRFAAGLARSQAVLGRITAAQATVADGLVTAIRYGSVRVSRELAAVPVAPGRPLVAPGQQPAVGNGHRTSAGKRWPGLPVTALELTASGSRGARRAGRASVAA